VKTTLPDDGKEAVTTHQVHRFPANLEIQYLGQEGFRLSDGRTTLVIDPYLSDSVDRLSEFPVGYWKRNYPPPVQPGDLRGVDLVLCTHDHLDHTDPATLLALAAASPACLFAGPPASVAVMHAAGLPAARTRVLNAGTRHFQSDVVVEPVPAAHEDYEVDAGGDHRFLGYVIRWGGHTFYHAGDTVVTPELSAQLEQEGIDVGFLPINGGDEARRAMGVVGNMNAADAAALAARHRFPIVVPMHYDLYPCNGAKLEELEIEFAKHPPAGRGRIKAFTPGETMIYDLTRSRSVG